jgi:hypothetical protein
MNDKVMFYDTDIDIFFSDFGVDAILKSQIEPEKTIKVIFTAKGQALEILDSSIGVETTKPIALCKSSDVETVAHNDIIEISGKEYYVISILPDGTGITTLGLSEDSNE